MINEQDCWQGNACKHFLYISYNTAPKERDAVATVISPWNFSDAQAYVQIKMPSNILGAPVGLSAQKMPYCTFFCITYKHQIQLRSKIMCLDFILIVLIVL